MMKCFSYCEQGLVRKVNQDRISVHFGGDYGIFLVADGVGGHYHGEIASSLIQNAVDQFAENAVNITFDSGVIYWQKRLSELNLQINQKTPAGKITAAAMVLLWIKEQRYALFSIGDCRCYVLSADEIWQLSVDDIDAASGNLRYALGAQAACPLHVETGALGSISGFVLCSDGTYRYCDSDIFEKALQMLARHEREREQVSSIYETVIAENAPDNLSLIYINPRKEKSS